MDQDLLLKYITGTTTQQETEEVALWIDADQANLKEFMAMRKIYDTTIWQKRDVSMLQKTKQQRNIGRELLKIAAIVITVLALSYTLLYKNLDSDVGMQTVYVPAGQRAQLTLADGTVVWMNSQSKLVFPNRFSKDTREVTLDGEAYFDVQKDVKKRFIVSVSHHSKIEVIGTRFNVKAYKEDKDIITTLIEGKVNFQFDTGQQTRNVELKPGEKLVYNSIDKQVNLSTGIGEGELSWKDGKIVFEETSLPAALELLSKKFDVEFIIRGELPKDDSFTSTFTNKSLEQILDYFQISSNMHWKYVDSASASSGGKIQIEIY